VRAGGRGGGGKGAAAVDADVAAECAFLRAVYPRVKAWIDWLLATQAGSLPHSFAWRGRDPGAGGGRELNPKTLTSGLDDYPRASHPSPADRHVDLLAWAALATRLLATVGRGAGRPAGEVAAYAKRAATLGDVNHIAALHWVEGGGGGDGTAAPGFYDYGLHTDSVALAWRLVTDEEGTPVDRVLLRRVASSDPPRPRHVTSARGVVGLFPLMLRLLPADSPHLAPSLALVRELACPAGVASLAPSAALRDAANTEHDAPYWRGAAWPPLTYLTLAALDHYATVDGPHAAEAASLRDQVRAAFVGNAVAQAVAAGGVCDVWERYKGDETGEGMGPRPFTGWGATVVLAAAGAWFEL
jgi:mannosyl-oligosaccharide glucosidase